MASKAKTPAPPRVQAPQRRSGARTPTPPGVRGDRRKLLLALFAASGVAVLVAVFAFFSLSGGSGPAGDSKVREAVQAAGGTFKSVAAKAYEGAQVHVPDGTKVKYPTFPPAGGPHYGETAVWGFYTEPEPVEPRNIIHNLEHGGVAIWWGPDTPQSTIDDLREFYDSDPVAMIGTRIEGLGKRVAITAWTGDPDRYGSDPKYFGVAKAAVFPTFDEKAFKTFRDAYRGKGPEGVPMEQNQPGT